MKLMYVVGNVAREVILAEDPIFPDVPLNKRYAPDFLANVVEVEDDVQTGYVRDETGAFGPAPEPEPTVPIGDTEVPIDAYTQLQLAMAELAEAQAADQTENELALAELAELIAGGAN